MASPWAPPHEAHIGRLRFFSTSWVPRQFSRFCWHQSRILPDRKAHSGRGSADTKASLKSPSQTFCACRFSHPVQERASGTNVLPAPGTFFSPVVLTTTAHGGNDTSAFGSA